MFLANIDEAERTDESADDMTAALTAPRPKKATHCPRNVNVSDILDVIIIKEFYLLFHNI